MSTQKRLGRGLEALLGSRGAPVSAADPGVTPASGFRDLPVGAIRPGRFQPRQRIDDEALAELVDSIRQQGVLQPIIVSPVVASQSRDDATTYEIVAGERRWRAARLAGQDTVPAIVRELNDQEALAVALIENLQREDLNPVEVAESLHRLTREFGLTHQETADAVGRSRSAVSNLLRLLELDASVREMLAAGHLDTGHARALLTLDTSLQARVAKKIVADGLSVRQVERLVSRGRESRSAATATEPTTADTQTRWLQHQIANELGVKVGIRSRKGGGHTLGIDFHDLEQLQKTLLKIEELIGKLRETAGPRVRGNKA